MLSNCSTRISASTTTHASTALSKLMCSSSSAVSGRLFAIRNELNCLYVFASSRSMLEFVERTGPFRESHARWWFTQMVAAIEHCHNRGVVHRDLKPEQVFSHKDCVLNAKRLSLCNVQILFTSCLELRVSDYNFSAVPRITTHPHALM